MTYKAVTVVEKEKAQLLEQEAEDKPLAPDEVMGKTLVSLISPGTELHSNYQGAWFPQQPGYAGVFEVEQVGEEVADLRAGDVCLCTGPGGIGGHRSMQRAPRKACVKLPDGLEAKIAVHARLMSVSMTTLTTTQARPAEKVLITGLGPIGHLAAQMFQLCGYRVIAVDPIADRRKLAADKGVETVLESVPLEDKELRADLATVVECSGHEQAVIDGCKAVRKGGEVVQIGVPWQPHTDATAQELMTRVYRGFLTYRSGSEWEIPRYEFEPFRTGCIFNNLDMALQWLAEGKVNVDGLYEVRSPEDPDATYQDLLNRRVDALSVLFDWSQV